MYITPIPSWLISPKEESVLVLVPATVQLGGPAGGKEMGKEINKEREANQLFYSQSTFRVPFP